MRARARSQAWTLVELVMTIVVIGILAGGAALFLAQGAKLWSRITFQLDAMAQAAKAMDGMQRELAQVKDDSGISTATATTLAFTDVAGQTVQYQYTAANQTLTRNGQLLAGGVTSAAFQYWNVKGQLVSAPQVAPPATKTDIWRIGVTLTLASAQEPATLSMQVLPRNFFRQNK